MCDFGVIPPYACTFPCRGKGHGSVAGRKLSVTWRGAGLISPCGWKGVFLGQSHRLLGPCALCFTVLSGAL